MGYKKAGNSRKRVSLLSAVLLFICISLFMSCSDEQVLMTLEDISNPIELTQLHDYLPGTWEGTFTMGGTQQTIRFSLQKDENDGFIGAFSIPQQEPAVFLFDDIEIEEDGAVSFRASSVQAGYTAHLKAYQESDTITLSGTWEYATSPPQIAMEQNHIEQLTRLDRPQDPVPPFPYHEEEVEFKNSKEEIIFSGSLTYPEGEGPFPAVILISGSGAHDRNVEIFGHRPFLVLADHLTRKGIAVLRYDDRGAGKSGGNAQAADSYDLSRDAEAALDYLLERKDTISDQIGMIGHSEGGMIASMVADKREEVDFLVLLASPGVPGDELLLAQTRAILEAQNLPESLIETTLATNEAVYQLVIEEDDEQVIIEEIYRMMRQVGVSDSQIEQQISSIMLPWFQFFIRYDPGEVLSNLTIPVLALCGTLDLQVVPEINLTAIEKHLQEAGNSKVKTKLYEGLNHLFQPAATGMVDEYRSIPITIEPVVLDDITQWILSISEGNEIQLSGYEYPHTLGRE